MRKIFDFFPELTPKTWVCFKEGYSFSYFLHDLIAGVSVGIIALPLTMALAIASGVSPEKGLYTAIIAGFLISLLGGSRVQIGGPTGAFVVIVYSVVLRHGYDGLAIATLIAGLMMIIMALSRAGALLKFIPYSVTTGIMAGIALSIFSSQMKDLFGLPIEKVPADFLAKWQLYYQYMSEWNPWAFAIGILSLGIIFYMRNRYPKIPGAIIAVILATLAVYVFNLPVATIYSSFGHIPDMLPEPALPPWSLEKVHAVFPDAITIALLGAIESLLSAVVADGMTGHRHRSNTELFAQGIANIGSILYGGIPATGAIARTAANIKMGAKTPVAGMIHALTLFILMVIFGAYAELIPMPALAAILIFVAWNMSEASHIAAISKGPVSDFVILLVTFVLTVLIDLTVAVQIGVLLSVFIFMKNMTDATKVQAYQLVLKEENEHDTDLILRKDIPKDVAVYEIDGPLFFAVSYGLNELIRQLNPLPKTLILRMNKVPLIDASGVNALKNFSTSCHKKGIKLYLTGVRENLRPLLHKTGLDSVIRNNIQEVVHQLPS